MNVNGQRANAAFDTAWAQVGATGPLADIAPPDYWREEID
jgi:hypothetical protein